MPEYLSPGVYVEEVDAGPKPIAAVATSIAGMVGVTQRGPTTPTLLSNYADFVRHYGGPLPVPDAGTRTQWDQRGHWWHAAESVKAFFDEGGSSLYFQRVEATGALPSSAALDGALFATVVNDVDPAAQEITLSHVVGVAPGTLDVVAADGSALGQVTIASVDYGTKVVTLSAQVGFPLAGGRDRAVIRAFDTTTPRDVLRVTAASTGEWGDHLRVQVAPWAQTRLELAASPTSGNPVSTQTTAAAAAGDTTIDVNPQPGSLDGGTATPFAVRINGGPPVSVTGVAVSGAALTLTLAAALAADLPAGSAVDVMRPASAGAVVTVRGAGRLYPRAVVQLDGLAGAEIRTVTSVAGSQVTLDSAPTNAYAERDGLTILEAEVRVSHRPVGGNEETERFEGLRLTGADDPASMIAVVNRDSRLVRLAAGADYNGTNLRRFPATRAAWAPLVGGDDALGALALRDFVGVNLGPGQRTGIQALEEIDQVAICAVPGMWAADVTSALITHCETLADRFAILDAPPDYGVQEIERFRSTIDTKYAALYFPWVRIADPRPGSDEQIAPPSGFMAGIYARTDKARGVHKAPANETIRSIRGLSQTITKREQDILNPQNINVLRAFPGRGNRVWGARVLTSDSAWKYVPVRRLFLMIEESIDEATQWVVFEPNDEPLWARVRQTVTRFLITQWRLGALQGATAEEAFYVACDRSTMTQDDIDNGRLICEIGIAPVRPAEFVIFRIQQKTLETVAA